jgi:membrane-associated phospholipid phosphatase
MLKHEEVLGKKGIITFIIIFLVVLISGLILISMGYNESFYSESESVRSIFGVITNLGEAIVFIVVIGILYIAYDKKFAKNMALNLMVSTYVNAILKDTFQDPRPSTNFDADKLSPENPQGLSKTSYGFPSGHNQTAVSAWGYIAYGFREKFRVVLLMAAIIFLVAISRVILGVHDLQDVIGGILIGLALLLGFIFLEPPATKRFNKLSMQVQLLIVIVVSVLLFSLGTFLFPATGFGLLLNPPKYTDEGSYALVGGVILGMGVGYILENRYVKYEPRELSNQKRILNLIVGMIIAIVVYLGLEGFKSVFDSVFYRYIRYAVVAFVLVFIIPLVLIKINKRNII